MELIALLHLLSTAFMTGLIWFVQVVHYPLFARVGGGAFAAYECEHVRRTTWVVAPAMIIELLCSAALLAAAPAGPQRVLAWIGAALLTAIWLATASVQVPCHRTLSRGFEPGVARRLERSNWLRTAAWSARLAVAAAIVSLGGAATPA